MSTGRRIQAPLPLHVVCIQHKRNAKSDDRQEYHHAFNALSSSHIVRERRDERTVTREYHFGLHVKSLQHNGAIAHCSTKLAESIQR